MLGAEKRESRKTEALEEGDRTRSLATGSGVLLLPANARVKDETREADSELDNGVSLEGRSIELAHGSDLFNNRAYSVLVDFIKEQEEDSGYLVTFDGSFSLFVGKSTLVARVGTDSGERKLNSGKIHTAVRKWHRLALTFSGVSGRADLFLDGERMCAVQDLKGATQFGNFFASLHLGCPKGNSFSGRIDNFKFLDRALSQEALRDR